MNIVENYLPDWYDEDGQPDPTKVNQYGRPHNWADTTVDHLFNIYTREGKEAAQTEWSKIVERDKPLQVDAVVVTGRFRQLILNGAPNRS